MSEERKRYHMVGIAAFSFSTLWCFVWSLVNYPADMRVFGMGVEGVRLTWSILGLVQAAVLLKRIWEYSRDLSRG